MADPVLGERVYNRRLDSLMDQLGTIMEVFQELNEKDPGPQERMALFINGINAVMQGSSDVQALREFGAVFKQTGELKAELLKGKDKR